MAKLLALVACADAYDGPWLRPCGRESGVRVYPELGPGEEVIIDVALDGDSLGEQITSHNVSGGFTPLALAGAVRYRARKIGHGTPISVEVVNDGKAHRKDRESYDPERRTG